MTAAPSEDPTTVAIPAPSERQGNAGHDVALDRANAIRLLTLRAAGLTYEQMAAEVGYADGSGARQALARALDRHEAENAAELRAIENLRLDADERVLRAIISDADTPIPSRLRAIDARTRVSARRARMNGLDAPVAIQISAGVQAELADALAEIGALVEGEVTDVHDTPLDEP